MVTVIRKKVTTYNLQCLEQWVLELCFRLQFATIDSDRDMYIGTIWQKIRYIAVHSCVFKTGVDVLEVCCSEEKSWYLFFFYGENKILECINIIILCMDKQRKSENYPLNFFKKTTELLIESVNLWKRIYTSKASVVFIPAIKNKDTTTNESVIKNEIKNKHKILY